MPVSILFIVSLWRVTVYRLHAGQYIVHSLYRVIVCRRCADPKLVYEVPCVHVFQTGLWSAVCSCVTCWYIYKVLCVHVSNTGLWSVMCSCLPDRSMKCHVSMSHILVYEVLYIYMSLSMYVRTVMYSVYRMCACPCMKRHVPWLYMNCHVLLCMHELSLVPFMYELLHIPMYELPCVRVCVWTAMWLCMNCDMSVICDCVWTAMCLCLCLNCHVSVHELSCVPVYVWTVMFSCLCMNCHVSESMYELSVSMYELSRISVYVWTVMCPCLCMNCHVPVFELSCVCVWTVICLCELLCVCVWTIMWLAVSVFELLYARVHVWTLLCLCLCTNCHVPVSMYELSNVRVFVWIVMYPCLYLICRVSVYDLSCVRVCVWSAMCPCLCMNCHVGVCTRQLTPCWR